MNYAKLIEGELVFAPNPILVDCNYIGNPLGEIYEGEGYKPVRYTSPGEAPDGSYWVETWAETETEIVQQWEATELPPDEDIDPAEALNILLGGGEA